MAAANGQYILVRREIYERTGGHEAVKSAILEDVELARRIKSNGGKLFFCRVPRGFEPACTGLLPSMWQGWTKNLYLLYGGEGKKMLARVAVSGSGRIPVAGACGDFLCGHYCARRSVERCSSLWGW